MTGYIPTLDQIDVLHHRIAPSQEAYDLIHTHCVVVATIARQIARRQNQLFAMRCKLGEGSGNALAAAAQDTQTAPESTDGVTGGKVPPRLIDEHLVTIGGLLHDIGTYRVLKHDGTDGEPLKFSGKDYIKHGLLGYEYLREQGVDESIAEFARNHTGVGLTRQMVIDQHLPLPASDYSPKTLEQEIVMVADKYNSKSLPPKFLTVDAYTRKAAKYGEDNKRRWLELVEQYGVPDVPALAERFHMRIVD
ncbi:HD domain-containing protein [Bifidobacterium leontopitheci]|nr:HD domain-containing protein [Bifidobacterium leontopitheci]